MESQITIERKVQSCRCSKKSPHSDTGNSQSGEQCQLVQVGLTLVGDVSPIPFDQTL